MDTTKQLIEIVLNGDGSSKEKLKLISELRKLRPPLQDRWIFRFVVWFLGAISLLSLIFIVILACKKEDVPDAILSLGAVAVGALAGVLVPSNNTPEPIAPMPVVPPTPDPTAPVIVPITPISPTPPVPGTIPPIPPITPKPSIDSTPPEGSKPAGS